jgi:Fe-S-cluster containining protein
MLAERDLVAQSNAVTRLLIQRAETAAQAEARRTMRVISCHGCTAAKGCCTVTVLIWLYEAVPVADRLRREGRDTPELRERLRHAANRMEALPTYQYRLPCVFLDERELCTVYDVRPADCGVAFVSTPPANCSDRDAPIEKFPSPVSEAAARAEMVFEEKAGLKMFPGLYMGALPRMVLLCLQAWDRRDYVDFLADKVPVAAHKVSTAVRRKPDE